MYVIALAVHSWLRWVVLVAAVGALLWSLLGTWSEAQNRWGALVTGLADLQLTLGLLLWLALSPITRHFTQTGALALDFFTFIHPAVMSLAVTALHLGRVRTKKVAAARRAATWRAALMVFLAAVVAAIPWPWLSYGRELWRHW